MANSSDTEATFDAILDQAVRELAGEAVVSPHPTPEALVALFEGRLAPDEAERVRGHVADCPACRDELAQLEDFDIGGQGLEHLEPEPGVTAEAWRRFQQAKAASPSAKVLTLPRPATPRAASKPPPRAAANEAHHRHRLPWVASIVLALGLGYVLGLQRAPGEAPAAPNIYFRDLGPDGGSVERSNAFETEVEVPAGMDAVTLRLNFGAQAPDEAYRAELLEDGSDQAVWHNPELLRQPAGQFMVSWQRRQVPSGRYRLRIFRRTVGEAEPPLATYSFQLRYTDP